MRSIIQIALIFLIELKVVNTYLFNRQYQIRDGKRYLFIFVNCFCRPSNE